MPDRNVQVVFSGLEVAALREQLDRQPGAPAGQILGDLQVNRALDLSRDLEHTQRTIAQGLGVPLSAIRSRLVEAARSRAIQDPGQLFDAQGREIPQQGISVSTFRSGPPSFYEAAGVGIAVFNPRSMSRLGVSSSEYNREVLGTFTQERTEAEARMARSILEEEDRRIFEALDNHVPLTVLEADSPTTELRWGAGWGQQNPPPPPKTPAAPPPVYPDRFARILDD